MHIASSQPWSISPLCPFSWCIYLHRGIAAQSFDKQFNLADHVEVTGASFENGLLQIELVRKIPEAMKPAASRSTGRPSPRLWKAAKPHNRNRHNPVEWRRERRFSPNIVEGRRLIQVQPVFRSVEPRTVNLTPQAVTLQLSFSGHPNVRVSFWASACSGGHLREYMVALSKD